MESRRPGSAPLPGNRVAFYIAEGRPEEKMSSRAEDPDWEDPIRGVAPPDRIYYLDSQIIKPISVIMAPLVADTAALFVSCRNALEMQRHNQASIFGFVTRAMPTPTPTPTPTPVDATGDAAFPVPQKSEVKKDGQRSIGSFSSSTSQEAGTGASSALDAMFPPRAPRPASDKNKSTSKRQKSAPRKK